VPEVKPQAPRPHPAIRSVSGRTWRRAWGIRRPADCRGAGGEACPGVGFRPRKLALGSAAAILTSVS
jgi:hypothetical protein